MFSLVNKHEEFFDYLVKIADIFEKGAGLISKGLKDNKTLAGEDVIELEEPADEIIRDLIQKMRHAFILPIDREDFYGLVSNLDDCIDSVQNVLMTLKTYDAGKGGDYAMQLADIIEKQADDLKNLFLLLKNIDKNEMEIAERSVHIKKLEGEADRIYCAAEAELLSGNNDIIYIMKWKRILKSMELVSDQVEKVANIIREVAIKYA